MKPGTDLLSRTNHYHRRILLNDRVRNGIGCGQNPMGTGQLVDRKCGRKIVLHNPSPRRKAKFGGNQAARAISTARLNTLPCLQLLPINLVVSQGPEGDA